MSDKKLVYLDNAATTSIHPKVFEKMLPFLNEHYGNPSSIHNLGRKTRVAIEAAREIISDFINANPGEIYFTSGGTEANNTAIFGIAKTIFNETNKRKLITGQAEHHCVMEPFGELERNGFSVERLQTTENGNYELSDFERHVDNEISLLSILHISNETGAINDIQNFTKTAHKSGALVHTDAVQSFGKVNVDVKKSGIDSLCGSAHKIYGPKGVGFVFIKSGTPFSSFILGGSQERNRRGGTENAAGIIGFAEAVKIADELMDINYNHVSNLKRYFIDNLYLIDSKGFIVNCLKQSSPYLLSLTLDQNYYNNDAETILMYLDINGIYASNGSACSSGTLKPSHVILAMGQSEQNAAGTIRFSFGYQNTIEEIDYTLEVLQKMTAKFKRQ